MNVRSRTKLTHWLLKKAGEWLTRDRGPKHSYLCDFNRISYELRPSDVLLIEGHNRVSTIIQQVTRSPWSHAALYVGRLHDVDDLKMRQLLAAHYSGPADTQLVIESVLGRGTVVTPLVAYQLDHIRICRPIGLSRADAQKVLHYAISRVGIHYSIRHVLDLFRFLLPWTIFPRRWRSSLFAHNALKPTEEICSSLIAAAFEAIDFPILPVIVRRKGGYELIRRNSRLFTPRDFDYSPFFSIIKYPMVDISKPGTFHNLLWDLEEVNNDLSTFVADETADIVNDASTNSKEV